MKVEIVERQKVPDAVKYPTRVMLTAETHEEAVELWVLAERINREGSAPISEAFQALDRRPARGEAAARALVSDACEAAARALCWLCAAGHKLYPCAGLSHHPYEHRYENGDVAGCEAYVVHALKDSLQDKTQVPAKDSA